MQIIKQRIYGRIDRLWDTKLQKFIWQGFKPDSEDSRFYYDECGCILENDEFSMIDPETGLDCRNEPIKL